LTKVNNEYKIIMGVNMRYDIEFWEYISKLVKNNEIIIDRPKGTRHAKYNDVVYEIDYGYIKDTRTTDNCGIDVFKGSLHNKNVNTIMCTIDLLKKDIEIKILIGCTEYEKKKIYEFLNNSKFMKAIIIEKNIQVNNNQKEIIKIEDNCNFIEIFEVFEDVVLDPSEENIKRILLEYKQNNERTLYGYFLNKKLVGIIGIEENIENLEVLHFGIHPEYRGKNLGTELMDFIKKNNKTIILGTDDDAIVFYKKYGFKCTEEDFNEEYQKTIYNCRYEQ
jgi:inorganic pyrophosphatase